MGAWKATTRMFLTVVPLLAMLMAGCATTIDHSYERSAEFASLRTYAWAPGSAKYSQNSLVEANVQFFADPLLEKKGLTKTTGKPDIVVTNKIDNYPYGTQESYELRALSLNMYRPDGPVLIWRGTASGSISTAAASGDLSGAVQSILAAFPPK